MMAHVSTLAQTPTLFFLGEVYSLPASPLLQLYLCKGAAGLQELLPSSVRDRTEKKGWENTF